MLHGHEPDLTEDDVADLFLLWRHGGVEPEDAWYRDPGWSVAVKAQGLRAEFEARGHEEATPESSLDEVPDDLKGL